MLEIPLKKLNWVEIKLEKHSFQTPKVKRQLFWFIHSYSHSPGKNYFCHFRIPSILKKKQQNKKRTLQQKENYKTIQLETNIILIIVMSLQQNNKTQENKHNFFT